LISDWRCSGQQRGPKLALDGKLVLARHVISVLFVIGPCRLRVFFTHSANRAHVGFGLALEELLADDVRRPAKLTAFADDRVLLVSQAVQEGVLVVAVGDGAALCAGSLGVERVHLPLLLCDGPMLIESVDAVRHHPRSL
jgi:hypothetical protein